MKFKLLIFTALLFLTGCLKIPTYKNIGNYTNGLPSNTQNFFITKKSSNPQFSKLTQHEYSYYEWKTAYVDHKLVNGESILTHKTFMDSDFGNNLLPDSIILSNYIFFLDDYRFFYLSQDDRFRDPKKRAEKSWGNIPLYFDKDHYKPQSELNDFLLQSSRGYYHVEGNKLILHFDGDKNFVVVAQFDNNTITFQSIINEDDYSSISTGQIIANLPSTRFVDIFPLYAQPVFELPTNYTFNKSTFSLYFGFQEHFRGSNRVNLNPLHSELNKIWKNLNLPYNYNAIKITDVSYENTALGVLPSYRIYTYHFEYFDSLQDFNISCSFQLKEDLNFIATW